MIVSQSEYLIILSDPMLSKCLVQCFQAVFHLTLFQTGGHKFAILFNLTSISQVHHYERFEKENQRAREDQEMDPGKEECIPFCFVCRGELGLAEPQVRERG